MAENLASTDSSHQCREIVQNQERWLCPEFSHCCKHWGARGVGQHLVYSCASAPTHWGSVWKAQLTVLSSQEWRLLQLTKHQLWSLVSWHTGGKHGRLTWVFCLQSYGLKLRHGSVRSSVSGYLGHCTGVSSLLTLLWVPFSAGQSPTISVLPGHPHSWPAWADISQHGDSYFPKVCTHVEPMGLGKLGSQICPVT